MAGCGVRFAAAHILMPARGLSVSPIQPIGDHRDHRDQVMRAGCGRDAVRPACGGIGIAGQTEGPARGVTGEGVKG